MGPLLQEDLELIAIETQPLWDAAQDQQLFLTGGTGFFGRWLVESFCYINRQFGLNAGLTVLSRNPEAFYAVMPHLKDEPSLTIHRGDVRTFDFPKGPFRYLIHAATDASQSLNESSPLTMMDTIVRGTERMLEFSSHCDAQRLLFVSSGAVYGQQPAELTHVAEDYLGGPDTLSPRSAYAEGKRYAELLCAITASTTKLEIPVARCFAFVGPHLPLDRHFAIGNFIDDALAGRPITLHGDGTCYRSYLYAADLMVWIWTILFQGQSGRAYNVGSEVAMPLVDVARVVERTLCPGVGVQVLQMPKAGHPVARYVPDTHRAQHELLLREMTALPEALSKTVAWLRKDIRFPVL